MKKIVYYTTKNGASEKYAKWLAEKFECKYCEFQAVSQYPIADYEKIYVISGTYGGNMPLTQFLKENWQNLASKQIVAIAAGMVAKNHWWSKITYKMVPKHIRAKVEYHKIFGQIPDKPETLDQVKKENLNEIE